MKLCARFADSLAMLHSMSIERDVINVENRNYSYCHCEARTQCNVRYDYGRRVSRPLSSLSLSIRRHSVEFTRRKVPLNVSLGVNPMPHMSPLVHFLQNEHKISNRMTRFMIAFSRFSISLIFLLWNANRFKRRWAMPWPLCDKNNTSK